MSWMKKEGKLLRRCNLQDKYCMLKFPAKSLPPPLVMIVVSRISDYARQETILGWIRDNPDFDCSGVFPKFLDDVEKHPDVPIEKLLATYKEEFDTLKKIHGLEVTLYMLGLSRKELLVDTSMLLPSDQLVETCRGHDIYRRDPPYAPSTVYLTPKVTGLYSEISEVQNRIPYTSVRPWLGLGEVVELYAEKETQLAEYQRRLAKLRESVEGCIVLDIKN